MKKVYYRVADLRALRHQGPRDGLGQRGATFRLSRRVAAVQFGALSMETLEKFRCVRLTSVLLVLPMMMRKWLRPPARIFRGLPAGEAEMWFSNNKNQSEPRRATYLRGNYIRKRWTSIRN